jgi:PAS domain S-box-containing protein
MKRCDKMSTKSDNHILLVDDDPAKRYTIAKTLIRAGFDIQEAVSGSEAMRLVAALPDLVILDVKLPDIDGFEVCRRIKSNPATSAIPVLHISTTFVDIEDKVHGLDSGADGYLTNVAEPMELIATVRALLRARRAEDAAQLSTSQWQTTFDAISDGVMLLDSLGKVVQANRTLERILGRPWTEIVGKVPAELWHEASDPEGSLFAKMLESRSREARDLSLGDCWLHVAVDPLRDPTGSIKGAICLVSDITNRKRMEMELLGQAQELQEASQRKDEFLAMLAHELRNPLAPLANTLQIIRLQVSDDPLIEEALDIGRRQIEHMSRLLEDLFDVSRITRGRVELRKNALDLNSVVNHAAEATLPLIEVFRHELTITPAPQPLWVEGDPTRLEQIISNLLTNAAKYTEPGGRIAITLGRDADQALLTVQDTGIGMTPELQTRIFELFVQDDRSLDRARGGLGIGLTLVRSLVELHEGTVSVSSPGPGRGSRFEVRLPLIAGQSSHIEKVAPLSTRNATRRLKILVVDDNRDSARTMAKVLELDGHDVLCAFDGLSVIEKVGSYRPDVILLDIGLPGIDGYQVARQLRDRYPKDGILLIAVTGYGGELNNARAQLAGFDHYLVKPVNLSALKERLANRPKL